MAQTSTSSGIADWVVGRIGVYGTVPLDSFTIDTRLTELGLDSIYALTLCGDIEDHYDVEFDPEALSEYATIRELAEGLSSTLAE